MVPAPGLIFTSDHVRAAKAQQSQLPFSAAWDFLTDLADDPEISVGPIFRTNGQALHWQFLADLEAGSRAIEALLSFAYSAADADIASFKSAFSTAQAIACLQNHPALTDAARTQILDLWAENAANLNAGDAVHLRAWSVLIELCAGLLLDQPDRVEMAAAGFRALVDMVQPHGYINALVQERDGQTLPHTIQMVQGLVLAAEVGAHHGLNLWEYEQRGVSVMTAALYPLYYYYYPEKWPWDPKAVPEPVSAKRLSRRQRAAQTLSDYTPDDVKTLFAAHSTFLELVNRRANGSIRAVTMILEEQRPIVDLLGGGPVTLTHGLPLKRRGLFGR